MAKKGVVVPLIINLHVKDPDAFHELRHALGRNSGKWLECGEYAQLELACEVVDGEPRITSASFERWK